MTNKDFYTLGIKLIGLYCLALAIRDWFKRFSTALLYSSPLVQTDVTFIVSHWLNLIIPAVLMLLGLYLIKDGAFVLNIVFRSNDDDTDLMCSKNFFATGIKLYGVFLIVDSISDCLGIVVNSIIGVFAPSNLSTEIVLDALQSALLPSLSAISLGSFCCVKANWFTRLGFCKA